MSTLIQYQPRWAPPQPAHPLAVGASLLADIFRDLSSSSIDQPIIATQLIASVSLLTQGVADVAWPNGLVSPIGQSVQLVAPSGSGKSVVSRLLVEPIHRRMRECARLVKAGQRLPEYFIEDATREAVIEHLIEWPLAALISDEAGLLKRLLNTSAPTLAKLIDGSHLRHARVSTGRAELTGHRFMMNLMEQPEVFQATKVLLGASNGGVGLVNRLSFGVADRLPVGTAVFDLKLSPEVKMRYERRIHALLEAAIELVHGGMPRPMLALEATAQRHLIELGTRMRTNAQLDARFAAASEYVGRHAERVLRLAGALHVFRHGPIGEVNVADVETARQVDQLSIESFVALTKDRPKPSQAEVDAELIERALMDAAYRGEYCFPLAYLRRISPNLGMTRGRFDRAVPVLAGRGRVTIFVQDRQDWLQVHLPQPSQIQSGWTRSSL